MRYCVTSNQDPGLVAGMIIECIRADARNHDGEPLHANVRWSGTDDVNFIHSPHEVNMIGHGDEASLVRAVGGRHGFAVAVTRVTGGLHPFLIKPTHDFSHASNPILVGEIIDPSVERGYNKGVMLPLSVYAGAFMRRIWPKGAEPNAQAHEAHERAHTTYARGMGTRGAPPVAAVAAPPVAPPLSLSDWIHIPSLTESGALASSIVKRASEMVGLAPHADSSKAESFARHVHGMSAQAATPEGKSHSGAVLATTEAMGQPAPEFHAAVVEQIKAGPQPGNEEHHDRLVSTVASLAQAVPEMVPDEIKGAALDCCAQHMSPADHAALVAHCMSEAWSPQWGPTPPPDTTLADDVRRANHPSSVDLEEAARARGGVYPRRPQLPEGFPAPGCGGSCSRP